MNRFCFMLVLLALPNLGFTQNQEGFQGGRWVKAGTFAISNLADNDLREKSYSKAKYERNRISTFLPGMTIVYKTIPSRKGSKYVEGVTHSGIPVHVLDAALSIGRFRDKRPNDVVVHREHAVCQNSNCTGDRVQVGIGHAFEIVQEDDEKIELIHRSSELVVFYPKKEFTERETSGFITRHKDRINPRWSIYDGYATKVSTGCGQIKLSTGFDITVSNDEFNSDPATWEVNDKRWSLKAIEIFDLGSVKKVDKNMVGRLDSSIKNPKSGSVAIDLSVFAYRVSTWNPSYYKFAGLLQKVNCHQPPIGKTKPTFVKQAWLYFDKNTGDDYEQEFPLEEHELPRQFSEKDQEEIFSNINRSFFYSINSHKDYDAVFDAISAKVPHPTAVANVIARLNASCSEKDRIKCGESSKFQKP